MTHGWTGGQYSLARALTGALAAGMLAEAGLRGGAVQAVVAALLLVVTALFIVGCRSRLTSLLLVVGWLPLLVAFGDPRDWQSLEPWGLVVGWLALVGHVLLAEQGGEPAYGSLDAVGRVDPGGAWRYPDWLFTGAWLTLGAFYLGAGIALLRDESWRLANALFFADGGAAVLPWVGAMPAWLGRGLTWLLLGTWLGFAPLALARRNRRLAWALALGVSLLVLPLAGYWSLALGLAMLHLLAFNPAWLPTRKPEAVATVYYDGHCGLCHRWARFVLAEERAGEQFTLAPLESDHFRRSVPANERERLPDSIIVHRPDGVLLARSAAVLHILDCLGGLWRVMAMAGGAVPSRWRDALYDRVAAVRRRLFAAPDDACPVIPPELRARFRM